ncbi:MAG: adenosylmethionine decarboxylase [Candidatus Brennerbacteria bacterium]|nr:adenosylmethionine decarboxylase [Candidatus Brennerbacteria bacterium]
MKQKKYNSIYIKMTEENHSKGKHLLAEITCLNSKNLDNVAFIKKLFNDIIKDLKLTLIAPPKLFKFPPPGNGITGYCVISESHISIHTWPEKNYFSFDIFSCRTFDEKIIEKILNESFQIKNCNKTILKRGLNIGFLKS